MKIVVSRTFRYMDGSKERVIEPGVYVVPDDVSQELADKIFKWGKATRLQKKAPENKKRGKAPENKLKVVKSTKRSRRARPKSDA